MMVDNKTSIMVDKKTPWAKFGLPAPQNEGQRQQTKPLPVQPKTV